MSLVEMQWNPSERQLRQFGLIAMAALPLSGWLLAGAPRPGAAGATQWAVVGFLAVAGAAAAIVALVRPRALHWPFVSASLVTWPLGLVVGELVLAIIYFLIFVPVSMIFRVLRRDALDRRIDRQAASYWQPKRQPAGPESYFRQS